MELEDQVCSLEMAKRLKELGMVQESHFFWKGLGRSRFQVQDRYEFRNEDDELYSAFTVAELGEMLPGDDTVASRKLNSSWRSILYDFRGLNHYFTQAKTEADARAKMLIYLLEKGLVKP